MKLKKTALQTAFFIILYIFLTGISTGQIIGGKNILRKPNLNFNPGENLSMNISFKSTDDNLNKPEFLFSYNLKLGDHLNLSIPLQDAESKAYRKAYKLILEKKWEEALEAMKKFLKEYPKSGQVSSAEYWMCYAYEKLDYPLSEVFDKYETFVKNYPRSHWADDARSNMIRIGILLFETGRKEYAIKIQELQRDNDYSIAITALYALGSEDEDKTLPAAIDLYERTKSRSVRNQIIYFLMKFKSEKVQNKLLEIAKSYEDPAVVGSLLNWLISKKPEDTIEIIRDIIWNSPDIRLQKNAIYALGGSKYKEKDDIIYEIIKSDNDPAIRATAVQMLSGKNGKDTKILKALEDIIFNEDNGELAETAVYALPRLDKRKGNEILLKVIKSDKDPHVRRRAIQMLSKDNGKSAEIIKALEDIIFNEDNGELAETAVYALPRLDKSKSNEILLKLIKSDIDPLIKRRAIQMLLSNSGKNRGIIEALEHIIFNENESELVKTAIYSLVRFDKSRCNYILTKVIKNHKDPHVRRRAIQMLSKDSGKSAEIIKALEDIIFNEDNSGLVETAIYALPLLDKSKSNEILLKVIKSNKNPQTRAVAVKMIQSDSDFDELLLDALEDIIFNEKNINLLQTAIYRLERIDKSKRSLVFKKIVLENKNPGIRFMALRGLMKSDIENALPILEEIIFNNSDRIRQEQTVDLLYFTDDERVVPLLIKIVKTHKNTKIRKAAIRALGNKKDQKVSEVLIDILKNVE